MGRITSVKYSIETFSQWSYETLYIMIYSQNGTQPFIHNYHINVIESNYDDTIDTKVNIAWCIVPIVSIEKCPKWVTKFMLTTIIIIIKTLTHCVWKRPQLYISVNNELLDIKSNDDLLSMFQCDQEICVCVSVYLFTLLECVYLLVQFIHLWSNANVNGTRTNTIYTIGGLDLHSILINWTCHQHSSGCWLVATIIQANDTNVCVCASHRASNSNDATQTLQYILSFKPLSLYNVLSLSPQPKWSIGYFYCLLLVPLTTFLTNRIISQHGSKLTFSIIVRSIVWEIVSFDWSNWPFLYYPVVVCSTERTNLIFEWMLIQDKVRYTWMSW